MLTPVAADVRADEFLRVTANSCGAATEGSPRRQPWVRSSSFDEQADGLVSMAKPCAQPLRFHSSRRLAALRSSSRTILPRDARRRMPSDSRRLEAFPVARL